MVRIWDIRTGKLLERFEGHRDSVYSVAFSPDGRSIVSGSLDKTIKVWDLSSQTLNYLSSAEENKGNAPEIQANVSTTSRHTFAGHKDYVLSVAFAGLNASFGRVDENGDPVATPGGDGLAEVEWLVSASKDRTVTFWDGGRGNGRQADLTSAAQFSLIGHRNSGTQSSCGIASSTNINSHLRRSGPRWWSICNWCW
jgi:glucose repression regulatory protein TUP1